MEKKDKIYYIYVVGREKNGEHQSTFRRSVKKLRIGQKYIGAEKGYMVLDLIGTVKCHVSDFHLIMYVKERRSKYITLYRKLKCENLSLHTEETHSVILKAS